MERTSNDVSLPSPFSLEVFDERSHGTSYRDPQRVGRVLRLTRRWKNSAVWVLLGFYSALLVGLGILFLQPGVLEDGWFLGGIEFALIAVAIGMQLVCLVNSTTLEVRNGVLRVSQSPILPRTKVVVETANIQQLVLREAKIDPKRHRAGAISVWSVVAVKHEGPDQTLFAGLPTREQAESIERRLEAFLDIENDEALDDPRTRALAA